jgi:hypothetical protein
VYERTQLVYCKSIYCTIWTLETFSIPKDVIKIIVRRYLDEDDWVVSEWQERKPGKMTTIVGEEKANCTIT